MKPTLQFQFDDLGALHRFLTKIIPVVDDGTLTEATMQTLKEGAEKYKPEPEASPLQDALQQAAPVPQVAPVPPVPPVVPVPPVPPVVPVPPVPQPVPQVYTVPQAPVVPEHLQSVVPTTEPTYSIDELARAASMIADTSDFQVIKNVLDQFGVTAISSLVPEQYGAFATALRGLGAQI